MSIGINNLKKRVGIISIISIIFEIARVVWTVFLVGCNKNSVLKLLGYFVLVVDALILKNFGYYFIGLIKNNVPYMCLEKWLKNSKISIIVTTIYFIELQYTHHSCNNYLISHHFIKHIPFYLCMICNTLCIYFFYWNAKKYNELSINDESQIEIKDKYLSQTISQSQPELISSILSQSLSVSELLTQLQMNLKLLQLHSDNHPQSDVQIQHDVQIKVEPDVKPQPNV